MSDNVKLLSINLSMFDGEGGGEGEASASPVDTQQDNTGEAAQAKETSSAAGENNDGQTEKVMTPEERRNSYRKFKAEYKDEFAKDTQRIIDRRFRETKALQEKLDKAQPILNSLMDRYGITDGDYTRLQSLMDNDRAYITAAAEEHGMDADMYQQQLNYRRAERERNEAMAEYEAYKRDMTARMEAQRQYDAWTDEAKTLGGEGGKYPGLDIDAELQNEDFQRMLRATGSVEQAYKIVHMDEIMNGRIMQTKQETEKKVADSIRAKGNRPAENGSSSSSTIKLGTDFMNMSTADFMAYREKVLRGEG